MAAKKVQLDLMEMLNIPKCVKFVSTVNRSNLFYMVNLLSNHGFQESSLYIMIDSYNFITYFQVREKSSVGKVVIDDIAEFIQSSYTNNESGIVYCFSRKECEQVHMFF